MKFFFKQTFGEQKLQIMGGAFNWVKSGKFNALFLTSAMIYLEMLRLRFWVMTVLRNGLIFHRIYYSNLSLKYRLLAVTHITLRRC